MKSRYTLPRTEYTHPQGLTGILVETWDHCFTCVRAWRRHKFLQMLVFIDYQRVYYGTQRESFCWEASVDITLMTDSLDSAIRVVQLDPAHVDACDGLEPKRAPRVSLSWESESLRTFAALVPERVAVEMWPRCVCISENLARGISEWEGPPIAADGCQKCLGVLAGQNREGPASPPARLRCWH